MRKFLFAALFALSAAPAHAVCLKLDCSQDPKAWADMLGTSPAQRREQQIAREAARAAIQQRGAEQHQKDLTNLGSEQRFRMIYAIEDSFSRLVGQPYTVIAALVVQRGDEYLFCGSGFYKDGGGVFVYDTRPGGVKSLQASRQMFAAAGCNDGPAVTLR